MKSTNSTFLGEVTQVESCSTVKNGKRLRNLYFSNPSGAILESKIMDLKVTREKNESKRVKKNVGRDER